MPNLRRWYSNTFCRSYFNGLHELQVFIECSAKTKLGIQQAFEELVTKVQDSKLIGIFFDRVVMTFANYKCTTCSNIDSRNAQSLREGDQGHRHRLHESRLRRAARGRVQLLLDQPCSRLYGTLTSHRIRRRHHEHTPHHVVLVCTISIRFL